jgi:hypothetical protein
MYDETTQSDEQELDPAGSTSNKGETGCLVATICFLLIDVIATCWISSLILASYMKLSIAVVLGIPVGILVFGLLQTISGTQEVVDWVIKRGILLVMALVLLPVFVSARKKEREVACLTNEKTLVVAELQYAQDWDDKLPAADHWADCVQPFINKTESAKLFRCPEASHRSAMHLTAL